MTVKIFTISHVPEELQQAWLQHLRDFDTAHPGCHFEVAIDAPDMPLEKMVELLEINPALDFMTIFERQKETVKLKWPLPPTHRTLRIANMVVATLAMVMAINADNRWAALALAWLCGFNLAAAIACTFYIRVQDSFDKLGEAFHAMSALNDQLIAGKVQIMIEGGDPNEHRPSLH